MVYRLAGCNAVWEFDSKKKDEVVGRHVATYRFVHLNIRIVVWCFSILLYFLDQRSSSILRLLSLILLYLGDYLDLPLINVVF